MQIDIIKASKITGGIAAFIVAAGVIYGTSVDAFDKAHEGFVTVGQLSDVFLQEDIKNTRKLIRLLEWQRDNGGLTEREEFLLQDAYNELDELTQ